MRVRVLAGFLVLAAVPACSANSSTSSANPSVINAVTAVGATSGDSAVGSTSVTSVASADASAESTTTIPVDFGDLGEASFCSVAMSIVSATSALIGEASPDEVKDGFAKLRASLATLAEKGATSQRPQFASALAVIDKASSRLVENGYDVAKTQADLAALDPEGVTISAITLVVRQQQSACPA